MRETGRVIGAAVLLVCAGVATSADADVLYGTYRTGSGQSSLLTIDTRTGVVSQVGGIGYDIRSLAYNPADQQLYGADAYHLYRINMATGQGTMVGAFQLDSGSNAQPSSEAYPSGSGSSFQTSSEAYPSGSGSSLQTSSEAYPSGSGSNAQPSGEPNYDYVTGAVTSISFDSQGTLYAMRNAGWLYTVDPSSVRFDSRTYLGTDYAGRLGIWGAGDNAVVTDATLAMTVIALPGDSGSSALPTVDSSLTAPFPWTITRTLGMTTNRDAQAVRQDYGSSSEPSSETGSDRQTSSEATSSETPTPIYSSEQSSSEALPAISSEATGSGSTALPSEPAQAMVGPGALWGLFNLYNPYVSANYRGIGVIDPAGGTVSHVVFANDGNGAFYGVNAVAFAPAAVVPNPAAAGGGIALAGGYIAARVWRGRRQRREHAE